MALHIGIIMDGNGRWATNQNLPRLAGHKAGVEAVMSVVRGAPELSVESITLFAFAIANWKRDKEEVDGLWELFDIFFEEHVQELIDEGVRLHVIGDRTGLPEKTLEKIEHAENDSVNNKKFILQVALNYDGIDEVARLIERTLQNEVSPDEIDSNFVLTNLDTLPNSEPDIIIRTGMPVSESEMSVWRSSAFLPLQSAQSVCISTPVLWPDFSTKNLADIITYADPDNRLFGGQRKK